MQVKKKKRTPKVGYEREGGEEEVEEAPQPPAPQPQETALPVPTPQVDAVATPTSEAKAPENVDERISEEQPSAPQVPETIESVQSHESGPTAKRKSGNFMNSLFRRKDKSDNASTTAPPASGLRKFPEQIENAASGKLFQ